MRKKIFVSIILSLVMANVYGQKVIVHLTSGTNVPYDASEVSEITFEEADEHDYVDLGLSVKWATCNLGALTPSEYGNYYAWGETATKTEYSKNTYAYYNSSTRAYTDIGTDISGTAYDAAHVILGGNWRMPTYTEWEELRNTGNCSWELTQMDGVNGYKVTSKKAGYTDKSIFLPAADARDEISIGSASSYSYGSASSYSYGSYWSSSLYEYYSFDARYLNFNGSTHDMNRGDRYFGRSVRPVTE